MSGARPSRPPGESIFEAWSDEGDADLADGHLDVHHSKRVAAREYLAAHD